PARRRWRGKGTHEAGKGRPPGRRNRADSRPGRGRAAAREPGNGPPPGRRVKGDCPHRPLRKVTDEKSMRAAAGPSSAVPYGSVFADHRGCPVQGPDAGGAVCASVNNGEQWERLTQSDRSGDPTADIPRVTG